MGRQSLLFIVMATRSIPLQLQSWNTTTTQFVSATGSITDSPDGNYAANANKAITTKGDIDLTNATAAYLTYYARWDIEAGFDYVTIAASENNTSYNPLCGIYNHKGNENQDNIAALYDGLQSTWVKEYINLADYLGKKIKLRFALRSDQGMEKDGFYFDEFAVHRVMGTPPVGINDVNAAPFYLNNVPNPCSGSTDIYYKLPQGKYTYTLLVTDPLGRKVVQQNIDPAQGHVSLNVSSFQSGMYFYRIVSSAQISSEVKKMIVQH
jgi:carboxypeptidase T